MSAGGARTILVTGAAGPAGRALGRQLAGRDAAHRPRAVGVDMAPVPVRGFDTVEGVPGAADARYEQAMRDLVARVEPDLVIPTVEDELPRVAVLWRASGLRGLVLSPAGPAAVAGDKLLTMWALARQDVAVPAHAGADTFASAADALAWAGGPVVVKPRVARGGRGVHVVEDPDDPTWGSADASWIVQAFAPGTEYSPQVYRSPLTGRCVVVVLRKAALENGRVGNATAVERLPDDVGGDVAALAVRAVTALELVGPVDLDVRRTADGTPVVLEVNARFGAVSASAPELLDAVLREWPG